MAAAGRPVARLTPGQQRFARFGAIGAAALFVALWAPSFPKAVAFGATAIGLTMAGFLWLAARRGTVVLTAVAVFVAFLGPWGGLWVLWAPYVGWSLWLLYRASKVATDPTVPREVQPVRKKKKAAAAPSAERRPPSQSRRYTPPARKGKRR